MEEPKLTANQAYLGFVVTGLIAALGIALADLATRQTPAMPLPGVAAPVAPVPPTYPACPLRHYPTACPFPHYAVAKTFFLVCPHCRQGIRVTLPELTDGTGQLPTAAKK